MILTCLLRSKNGLFYDDRQTSLNSYMHKEGLILDEPFLYYGHRLYFSTDTSVCGKDVYDIYRTRFQIEFCFRDGHQFTGLLDCQARDEKALDFA